MRNYSRHSAGQVKMWVPVHCAWANIDDFHMSCQKWHFRFQPTEIMLGVRTGNGPSECLWEIYNSWGARAANAVYKYNPITVWVLRTALIVIKNVTPGFEELFKQFRRPKPPFCTLPFRLYGRTLIETSSWLNRTNGSTFYKH